KLKINMERQWPEPKDGEPRLHIKEPGNSPVIPDGLSTVCAEAYQVVGVMADALGVFGDAAVQKVLDNLSQQKLVHRDVLPFSLPATPDGWISCSERMPEMGERQCYVLAADFKNNYPPNIPNTQVGVYGDWFNDGKPTWDDGDGEDLYLKEVTHWMQLPEPPQEVK
ncbi:dATP/dGTP pyrophosphohydrolase domain-containing protein, partial [Escherichia coli]